MIIVAWGTKDAKDAKDTTATATAALAAAPSFMEVATTMKTTLLRSGLPGGGGALEPAASLGAAPGATPGTAPEGRANDPDWSAMPRIEEGGDMKTDLVIQEDSTGANSAGGGGGGGGLSAIGGTPQVVEGPGGGGNTDGATPVASMASSTSAAAAAAATAAGAAAAVPFNIGRANLLDINMLAQALIRHGVAQDTVESFSGWAMEAKFSRFVPAAAGAAAAAHDLDHDIQCKCTATKCSAK